MPLSNGKPMESARRMTSPIHCVLQGLWSIKSLASQMGHVDSCGLSWKVDTNHSSRWATPNNGTYLQEIQMDNDSSCTKVSNITLVKDWQLIKLVCYKLRSKIIWHTTFPAKQLESARKLNRKWIADSGSCANQYMSLVHETQKQKELRCLNGRIWPPQI